MQAKIYVQLKMVVKPVFVILYEDGTSTQTEHLHIDGPSECVFDPALGKFIVLTSSPLRITDGKPGPPAL